MILSSDVNFTKQRDVADDTCPRDDVCPRNTIESASAIFDGIIL